MNEKYLKYYFLMILLMFSMILYIISWHNQAINSLQNPNPMYEMLQNQINSNYETIIELSEKLNSIKPFHARVKVTSFQSLESQTNSDPELTAINLKLKPGMVAVSRDLLEIFPLGGKIWLEGFGVYTIGCVTNKRLKNTVDIYTSKNIYKHNVLIVLVK